MSEKERNAFEKRLEADPFEMDASEGFSSIGEKQLREDIERLQRSLDQRISKRRFPAWYRISAAAVILLAVTSLFLVRELRQPEMVVSENIQGPGKGLIDKMEDPEPDLNEISEIEKPAMPEVIYERASEENIVSSTKKEELDAEPAKAVSPEIARETRLKEEQISEGEMASLVAEEVSSDSLVPERAAALDPLAGATDKSMAKRSRMAEAAPSVYTERKMVKGIVTASDDKLPLPGVSIKIKGTDMSVLTDIRGFFEIGADSNQKLIASLIGMETKEITSSGNEIENIVLEPDIMSLDELVVVAYSSQEEREGVRAGANRVDVEDEGLVYMAAVPAGGMDSYREYIKDNIRFPAEYTLSNREVVRVRFTVSPGRNPSGFEILKSPGEEFSKEAVRLISEGPGWNPATSNGEPFEDTVSLRIVFRRATVR